MNPNETSTVCARKDDDGAKTEDGDSARRCLAAISHRFIRIFRRTTLLCLTSLLCCLSTNKSIFERANVASSSSNGRGKREQCASLRQSYSLTTGNVPHFRKASSGSIPGTLVIAREQRKSIHWRQEETNHYQRRIYDFWSPEQDFQTVPP
jgi:hypothetical protein